MFMGSHSRFNPTMVRLLPYVQTLAAWYRDSFNPTMVRLLLSHKETPLTKTLMVSIPQWCDCCVHHTFAPTVKNFSFNPTMVRLLRRGEQREGLTAEFQSHNGAIAAPLQGFAFGDLYHVSIPQWCDCCRF